MSAPTGESFWTHFGGILEGLEHSFEGHFGVILGVWAALERLLAPGRSRAPSGVAPGRLRDAPGVPPGAQDGALGALSWA